MDVVEACSKSHYRHISSPGSSKLTTMPPYYHFQYHFQTIHLPVEPAVHDIQLLVREAVTYQKTTVKILEFKNLIR